MTASNRDGSETIITLAVVGAFGFTGIVIIVFGCAWCRNKWKKFRQKCQRLPETNPEVPPPVQNVTEFTIFPPPSSSQFSLPAGFSSEEVIFEPLPEIRSRGLRSASENVRPARFAGSYGKVSLQDWFDETRENFPRNQLKYFREFGSTWFGQAVEGEAYNIVPGEEKTKVIVKILRVDASATEHMQYLEETRPFRDLNHPNLLRLLGRCLEVHPFLLLMEHCNMDLKAYLIEQRKSPEIFLKNGLLLQMACNIAAALQHMHEHGFIHMDIAARSCLVSSDLTVKVGDYGTAVNLYRSDFLCLGDVAFPIRWCAPETLTCTEKIIEAKDITRESNIWSFGVLLWELLEFGKLPYFGLVDDDVIRKVLVECSVKLEKPKTPCVHNDMIYKIMQLCWLPSPLRPTIHKIVALLSYLYENKNVQSESTVFESRWNSLQAITREHNLHTTAPNVPLHFESDFIPKKENEMQRDCDSMMSSDSNPIQYGNKSPSSGSFSIGYEGELANDISPSLLNLRGSVEDLVLSVSENGRPNSGCNSSIDFENGHDVNGQEVTNVIRSLDTVLTDKGVPSESACIPSEKNACERQSLDAPNENNVDHSKVNGAESTESEHQGNCKDHHDAVLPIEDESEQKSNEILHNMHVKNMADAKNSVHVTLYDDETNQ